MIKGNLTLSSDLRRLGFVKVVVFLTHPSSFTNIEPLVARYKRTVLELREKAGWCLNPITGKKVSGKGIGKEGITSEKDVIALNHVLLAQNLGFIRKSVYNWSEHGWHYSSLHTDERGLPLSLNPANRVSLMGGEQAKGLVASFSKPEKLVFCNALFYADFDGIFPLLECLSSSTKTTSDLSNDYFLKVASWYERKSKIEINSEKRNFYLREKAKLAKPGSYTRTHILEQIYPRLSFLKDVGFIDGNDEGYSLSSIAREFLSSFPYGDNSKIKSLLDEKGKELVFSLSDVYSRGLGEISKEEFDKLFAKMSAFYRTIGLLFIPFESLFVSISAAALGDSKSISLPSYVEQLQRLVKQQGIAFSTTVPGRKYVKI